MSDDKTKAKPPSSKAIFALAAALTLFMAADAHVSHSRHKAAKEAGHGADVEVGHHSADPAQRHADDGSVVTAAADTIEMAGPAASRF